MRFSFGLRLKVDHCFSLSVRGFSLLKLRIHLSRLSANTRGVMWGSPWIARLVRPSLDTT